VRHHGFARGSLYGVTATSAANAWAAGTSISQHCPTVGCTLIVRWNGTAWKRVRSPSPPGGVNLFGVASLSTDTAWAVGGTTSATPPMAVILRWNGTNWKRVL